MEEEAVVVEPTEEIASPGATEGTEPTEGQNQEAQPTPEEVAAQEEEKVSKSSRFQELVHRRKEAELAVDRERAERQRLEERLQAIEAERTAPKPTGKPKLADFEDADEWADAVAEWSQAGAVSRLEEKLAAKEQETAKSAELRSRQEAVRSFEAKEEVYRASLGDKAAAYDVAQQRLKPFVAGNLPLVKALLGCPPEVAHALGEDLELAEQIGSMDPYSAGVALGELKARVTDKGRQGRKFSTTPPPETTVAGLRTGGSTKNYSTMDGDEYGAIRRAEEAAKRR